MPTTAPSSTTTHRLALELRAITSSIGVSASMMSPGPIGDITYAARPSSSRAGASSSTSACPRMPVTRPSTATGSARRFGPAWNSSITSATRIVPGTASGVARITSRALAPAARAMSSSLLPAAMALRYRNQPSSTQIRPEGSVPKMSTKRPKPATPQPSALPAAVASCVARIRSPVDLHSSARSARPPSSGKPGSRLKAAINRLMVPRNRIVSAVGSCPPATSASAHSRPPAATEARGPAIATQNSSDGVESRWSITE